MIPDERLGRPFYKAFPRTRGDDPGEAVFCTLTDDFSPHPRG